MTRMTRSFVLFVAIGILFSAVGGYFGIQRFELEKAESAAVANFFGQSLLDDKAKSQNLAQWKGKTLVINFWATWCAPCVQEMPELSALQIQIAKKNAQIIGIGIDSSSNIQEFSAKYRINYPLYVAGMSGTELSRQFGNLAGGLPFTVLLSSDGQVKKTYLGRLKLDQLRADLAAF